MFDLSLMGAAGLFAAGISRRGDLNTAESFSTLLTASSYAASGDSNLSVWAQATIFAVWRRLSKIMMSLYTAKRASSQTAFPLGSGMRSKSPTHS